MNIKRIIFSGTAFLVGIAIIVTALLGFSGGGTSAAGGGGPGVILSDGKTYTVAKIDAVPLATEIPKDALPAVGNKETLLKLLKERGALYDRDAEVWNYLTSGAVDWWAMEDSGAANSAEAPAMPAPGGDMLQMDREDSNAGGGEASHSETNEQVAGVSEGDIVKTDGRYLYALSGSTLRIIKADGAQMDVVSAITFDDVWGAEFYLMGDKLAVIGQKQIPWEQTVNDGGYYHRYGDSNTVLTVYDITDRAAPAEARRVEMDGWNVSSRAVGSTVYLITNKHIWVPYDMADSEAIMPCALDTMDTDKAEPIGLDRIFYIPGTDDSSYLIVGALDISKDEPFEPKAYLGAGSAVYMSRNAVYVTQTRWLDTISDDMISGAWPRSNQVTEIMRFTVDGTEVVYSGKGEVEGYPVNQYSMDEYNGFFRIATTEWGVGTRVTVLDGNMILAGRTEALMPNETMRSSRFMGDMGYLVTFENTDPLFTIDLSDPYNPKVLGELKIPGFSQYLHPVGDGLLMGIGRDTEELFSRDATGKETIVGFRDVGMKISLFDVSNPFDPKEIDVLALGEGWAEVAHNPRALMCDPARGLYGFTMERWNNVLSVERYVNHFAALLIRVEGNRLSLAAELENGQKFSTWNSRLSFIGETLYLSHEQGVWAYDYYTFEQTGTLSW